MKNIKYLILSLFAFAAITSCIDDDNDELTGNNDVGGLVSVNNGLIGYVVGNDGTYTAAGSVYQGKVQTNKIDIYKSFTDAATGETSNENLLVSIPISDITIGKKVAFDFSFKYEDLIAGLTLNGAPLPANDGELNIGDFWELRYESSTSDSDTQFNGSTTKVSVGTRFAGTYRTLDAAYYRIGVLTYSTADFQNFVPEQVIESVDATTYRVVEYFGVFGGNTWYFQIDENDKISYPAETPDGEAQTGNGQPFITCELNPGDMTNVPCGSNTNYVERDDVTGADKLYLSYGYFTGGSGAREFYQVLEKIVD